jgi:undecaprenyl-diphosphatase
MDFPVWIKIIILGVIEGLTEFLPVSSTGHLIVFEKWLNFNWEVFTIFIQLGALAAVWWLFRERIKAMIPFGHLIKHQGRKLLILVLIGFVPVLIIGFLTKKYRHDSVSVIAWATLVGGIVILLIERFKPRERFNSLESLTPMVAVGIGLGQCLALIPGTSRSGATIMTGLALGLSRAVATEYTFLLAIPTMTTVTVYELWKSRHELSSSAIGQMLLGAAVAFIVAFVVVKWFVHFVQSHSFAIFAWYRIGAGAFLLWLLSRGFFGISN